MQGDGAGGSIWLLCARYKVQLVCTGEYQATPKKDEIDSILIYLNILKEDTDNVGESLVLNKLQIHLKNHLNEEGK